jgi:xanthine dehydrogenase accessory factor
MIDIYQQIVELGSKGEDAALVTIVSVVGSTPREEGAKMLVKADGSIVGTIGGGNLDNVATKEALEAIRSGKAKRLDCSLQVGRETEMICGGEVELFIEPILSNPTIYIFGGGHIGLALAKIGNLTGFKIVVIDDRPEFANHERFPEAEETIVDDFEKVFSKLKIDRSSYIVITTHGHKGDEAALEGALGTKARYIGMIGSKNKIEAVYSHLREKGFSQEQLDCVHSPIGLRIRAQTPEEIAVSILAEIIAVRRTPSL